MTAALSSSGTLVVIEDEEDTRELLRELLEGEGHRVLVARDGVEGLEVLRSTLDVRLVLLDLLMPRLDGFGVLEALAADAGLASLFVVVTTSAPDQVPAGARSLPKPVDIDQLLSLARERCGPTPAP